ncbi:hypothetical protein KKD61_00345 [Patescibacteria group bacterium]|nr:hypothetical protein [Patescibacteria group bacterium]
MTIERSREILRQTDANSCLACSLFFVAGKITGQEFSKDDERQLCFDSFGRCRESLVLSYLWAFMEHFPNLDVTITVDNEFYEDYLKRLVAEKIEIESSPVTIGLIRSEASKGPLIVLVDRYFFDYEIHIPHYIVVENQGENNFSVADPWQGKTVSVNPTQLQEAIFGAKHILQWAPMIIKIEQQIESATHST